MPSIQKSLRIRDFIKRYQMSNHFAPTIAEIGRHFDMSSSASVHLHLTKLVKLGLIRRKRYSRVIEIVEQA